MANLKAWFLSQGVSLLLGGAGLGALLLMAKKFLPGYLAGLLGSQIVKLEEKCPEDRELILAVVKWAEKKVPNRGQGSERFKLAADKLVSIFPAISGQRDKIAAVIEEAVWRMDEELSKQSNPGA